MDTCWLNHWEDYDVSQLEKQFGLEPGSLESVELLLASYAADEDSGYAFVLYRDPNGELYEINASHDSEASFHHQWQPELTTLEALLFRLTRGNLGTSEASCNVFADQLKAVLNRFLQ